MTIARALAVCICAFLVAAAAPAGAASVSGVATGPGVIWVTQSTTSPMAGLTMRQNMKTFVPNLVVATAGSSVQFPNDDNFYHSVYSESKSNPFDLGLYDTGPGKSVLFDQPGIVTIRCHVHGSMRATVVVVDGPFAVVANAKDAYKIDGVTRGPHDLHVWTGGDTYTTEKIIVK